jgi:hypothetical protein
MKMRAIGLILSLVAALFAAPVRAQSSNYSNAVLTSSVTITPNASAYSAGQCLGGILAVPGMIRPASPGGTIIQGVTLVDPAHQTAANDAMNIWVFNQLPTGTYTDHAACNLAAADIGKFVGTIPIAAANCMLDAAPTNTICSVTTSLYLTALPPNITGGSSSLWFVPVITATPTYGANNLTLTIKSQPN